MSKVLVFGNDCGFRSRILGAAAPLGALFFLSLGIFGSRPFWGRGLGFGCACWGFEVVPESVRSDAWSWGSGNLEISC